MSEHLESTEEIVATVESMTDSAGELPVAEQMVDESPVVEQPVDESPVDEAPVGEQPVDELPVDEAPVDELPVDESPVVEQPEGEQSIAEQPAADLPSSAGEAPAGESTPTGDDAESALPDDDSEVLTNPDGSARVVRMLHVGQEVTGVVRRTTDFGAFVDIGVGRDGLIHVSELSNRRVGKVTDVLREGQEVTVWIKKLDRERNRISLTMLSPGTKTIRDLHNGDIVEGTVSRILPYGAFIDIGVGRDALLHVREMSEGYVAKPEDVVQVGEKVEARIIEVSRRRQRIDLSLKGLRPEPEPEPEPEPAATPATAPAPEMQEDEASHPLDEVEVLTPMEMAFKKAMEAEGIKLDTSAKKQGRRRKRAKTRAIQDEIIARTLEISKGK